MATGFDGKKILVHHNEQTDSTKEYFLIMPNLLYTGFSYIQTTDKNKLTSIVSSCIISAAVFIMVNCAKCKLIQYL